MMPEGKGGGEGRRDARASLAWAATIAFAALLALPFASGDHVYSHRVMVEGRLVDGAGLPIPNVTVEARVVGDNLTDACPTQPHRPVTDAWGDFAFCWHKHALRSGVTVTVIAGNATATLPLDAELRKMTFLLQDENATSGVAPEAWNATYRIEGRVWYRGSVDLDGVEVSGIAMVRAPVNVTLVAGAGNDTSFVVQTDGYGDYNETFQIDPAAGKPAGRVEVSSVTLAAPLDPVFHRTVVDVKLPVVGEDFVATTFPVQPGSRDPPASPLLAMATVLGATISFAWVARRK